MTDEKPYVTMAVKHDSLKVCNPDFTSSSQQAGVKA
jgi:hypothetical protein